METTPAITQRKLQFPFHLFFREKLRRHVQTPVPPSQEQRSAPLYYNSDDTVSPANIPLPISASNVRIPHQNPPNTNALYVPGFSSSASFLISTPLQQPCDAISQTICSQKISKENICQLHPSFPPASFSYSKGSSKRNIAFHIFRISL